jgi:hypothetical protein
MKQVVDRHDVDLLVPDRALCSTASNPRRKNGKSSYPEYSERNGVVGV